jgi:pimeloyl-ACP methyl ester carboxylesterase
MGRPSGSQACHDGIQPRKRIPVQVPGGSTMPVLKRDNADLYYEAFGTGEAIITLHGLSESTLYWRLTGVTEKLAKRFRVISMDMRGHGRTVVHGEPYGFDDETIGGDLTFLADQLGFEKFHLLSHATGGFVAARYAMTHSSRLLSLILTDTASSTATIDAKPDSIARYNDKFAKMFEGSTWDDTFERLKKNPGPFFRGIVESNHAEAMLKTARAVSEVNDRNTLAAFIRSFYTDPDPRIEGLRKITCPTLIIYGEKDDLFIESSKRMAREIPGAKLIEYEGIGHMTAIEAPERLAEELDRFLSH